MAGITLTQAQAELDRWRATYAKLTDVAAHSVQGGGGARQITKITPDECLRQIEHCEREVTDLTRGGIRARAGVTAVTRQPSTTGE